MRRRRQKNPLLMRIILISIGVHIVALPILAHFGAFKKIQEHFVQATMVVVPPPPDVPKQEVAKQKAVEKRVTPAASKGKASAKQANRGGGSHPHVATASGPGGDDTGAAIDPGSGKVGEVPKDTGPGNGKPTTEDQAVVKTETKSDAGPPVKAVTHVDPPPPVIVKQVQPIAPIPPPHEPILTEATPIDDRQPQPTIPDELRADSLDTTVVVDVVVDTQGKAVTATISQSTGKRELDRLALETARQWRFKPATKDGTPVEGRVRLHIEFQVS